MAFNQIFLIIGLIGAAASIGGIVYGILQNRARVRMEADVKSLQESLFGTCEVKQQDLSSSKVISHKEEEQKNGI